MLSCIEYIEVFLKSVASMFCFLIFCLTLVRPLRYSKKRSGIIAFSGILVLNIPVFCFPALFDYSNAPGKSAFVFNVLYWSVTMLGQYMLIFLLSKRKWLSSFFLLMVWDIFSSLISVLLSFPIVIALKHTDIFPAAFLTQIVITIISCMISILCIRLYGMRRIILPNKVSFGILCIYTLIRILTPILNLPLIGTVPSYYFLFFTAGMVLFLIVLLIIVKLYLMYYEKRQYAICHKTFFTEHSSRDGLTLFLNSLHEKCSRLGISLYLDNNIEDQTLSRTQALTLMLSLGVELLFLYFKNAARPDQSMCLVLKLKMNHIIISMEGTIMQPIQDDSATSFYFFSNMLLSLKEIFLNYILKKHRGQAEFLDYDSGHLQIRMIYPIL